MGTKTQVFFQKYIGTFIFYGLGSLRHVLERVALERGETLEVVTKLRFKSTKCARSRSF